MEEIIIKITQLIETYEKLQEKTGEKLNTYLRINILYNGNEIKFDRRVFINLPLIELFNKEIDKLTNNSKTESINYTGRDYCEEKYYGRTINFLDENFLEISKDLEKEYENNIEFLFLIYKEKYLVLKSENFNIEKDRFLPYIEKLKERYKGKAEIRKIEQDKISKIYNVKIQLL